MQRPARTLTVAIERGRSALRVIARTSELHPEVLVDVSYPGGPEGISFRLTRNGESTSFAKDAIARHPAISAVLRLIADEVDLSKEPSQELLAFLFHSLFVYVDRLSTPMDSARTLHRKRGRVRDRRIERALELLNLDITKRWTVELLARAVGLSRPVFAKKFVRTLGRSPMRYLTQQRMQLAAALLLDPEATLAEVASRVGYQSEFAFSRAFKRHHDVPPGQFRQRVPTTRATLAMAA